MSFRFTIGNNIISVEMLPVLCICGGCDVVLAHFGKFVKINFLTYFI